MQMAELRAKPEKTWPWKKDDQSGRPIRLLQIKGKECNYPGRSCLALTGFEGVRYIQWDDEKGSVVKYAPVDPGPQNSYASH